VPPLPIVSGDECIAVLRRFGYEVARQSGSHVRMVCVGRSPVTVPRARFAQARHAAIILRVAEISVDAFSGVLGS
jgi:predicted RNA binding protein YcfA (HicA-like mRNA interferase family)